MLRFWCLNLNYLFKFAVHSKGLLCNRSEVLYCLKFTVLESALNQRILLITGWGGGTKLLQPLSHALQHKGHSVELINIFNGLDTQALQQYTEQAKDFDVIIGWSLGTTGDFIGRGR